MALPLPDKPSIAVQPFVNMSDDPEQEYLSDGITEGIIKEAIRLNPLPPSQYFQGLSDYTTPLSYHFKLKTFNALSRSTACFVLSRMGNARNSFLERVRPSPLVAHRTFLLPALSINCTSRWSRLEGM